MHQQTTLLPKIVLPCRSVRLTSSEGLGWKELTLESHSVSAEPAEESSFPNYILEVASGRNVAVGERSIGHGLFKPYAKRPGAINLYTEGVRPALRPSSPTELFVCAINPGFVSDVQKELELPVSMPFAGHLGVADPATAHLVKLLEAETHKEEASGSFYAEHLVYALTARLLTLGKVLRQAAPVKWGLPKASLKRVIETMRSDLCASHDLEALAKESGYSRHHFLRMFRIAMHCTPHRYLLQLRVEKAQFLINNRSLNFLEIATECGFSSHSHMSKTFRQVLGMTPNEYRHTSSLRYQAKVVSFDQQ